MSIGSVPRPPASIVIESKEICLYVAILIENSEISPAAGGSAPRPPAPTTESKEICLDITILIENSEISQWSKFGLFGQFGILVKSVPVRVWRNEKVATLS